MATKKKRIALITQKFASLETQLNALNQALAENTYDQTNAKLRSERLSQLFFAYEELHDELIGLDPEHELIAQLPKIRDVYYSVVSRIGDMPKYISAYRRRDVFRKTKTSEVTGRSNP